MITNATILRADASAAPSNGGAMQWTDGAAINLRCFAMDDDAAATASATANEEGRFLIVRVPTQTMGWSNLVLATEMRLCLQIDGEAASGLYRITGVGQRPKGSISFVEVKCRRM